MAWENTHQEIFGRSLALSDIKDAIRKLDTTPIKVNEPKQKRRDAEVKCRIIHCIGNRLPPGWTIEFSFGPYPEPGPALWFNPIPDNNSWLGNAAWNSKKLSFNLFILTRIPDNNEIEETAIHELAHAYHGEETQRGSNHRDRWHELCVKLGGKGESVYIGGWYE